MQVTNNKLSFSEGESQLSYPEALLIFIEYAPDQLADEVSMAVCRQMGQTPSLWAKALSLCALIEETNPSLN